MGSKNIKEIVTIVTTIFVFTAVIVPFIKDMAMHIGAVDRPNKRKVHTGLMPRLGGLAIFFGFLLGYMLFSKQSIQMNSILIGSFIIVLTGVIDDIKPLKPSTKFVGQLFAALVVAVYGGITLSKISSSYLSVNFGLLTYPITLFFILGIVNAINFIDGLDGLATGISSIFFLTVGIIAIILNNTNGLDVTLSFIMLGATLGFLVHNFYPAKIFLGDTGSMFLGFIIAVIALLGFKNVTLTSFIIPILILGVPLLDTLFAILRRFIKGEPISKPDKEHLHHQFLKLNFSHRSTVLLIYLINSLFAVASILYILKDKVLGKIIYIIILIIWLVIVIMTDIISDKRKIRDKINHK
ncbi:MAG: MraY family glycosyltransferase [Bacilli bacterium]|nr:MraY family glycosyltransferase [Bacilli bacterium]